MHCFRPGLLDGRSIALSGVVPESVSSLLQELGAHVSALDEQLGRDESQGAAPLDALVCGTEPPSGDARAALGPLEREWAAVSAAARAAFIPESHGRIVLLAPRAGDRPGAEAVRAALENLARTLSVEWARFAVTAVAIAPGAATTDEQLATLVAFLCSPAGAYFSGCRFDLGVVSTRVS